MRGKYIIFFIILTLLFSSCCDCITAYGHKIVWVGNNDNHFIISIQIETFNSDKEYTRNNLIFGINEKYENSKSKKTDKDDIEPLKGYHNMGNPNIKLFRNNFSEISFKNDKNIFIIQSIKPKEELGTLLHIIIKEKVIDNDITNYVIINEYDTGVFYEYQ